VHAAGEFLRERGIDHAMALDPALFFERLRHNIDPEVGFSSGPVARMTFMLVGLIDHPQALRRKRRGQLFRDDLANAHLTIPSVLRGMVERASF
jgi:hypothetical protein